MLNGTRSCAGCGETIVPGPRERNKRKWCSETCRVKAHRRKNPEYAARVNEKARLRAQAIRDAKPKTLCANCGAELKSSRGRYCPSLECQKVRKRVYRERQAEVAPECSEPGCCRPSLGRGLCGSHYSTVWRRENPERALAKQHRRRARKLDAFVEDVDISVVLDRDGWECGICGSPIPRHAVWPDLEYRTLDHIVPLAKGGEHSYANIQAAHLSCNSSKRDTHEPEEVPLIEN